MKNQNKYEKRCKAIHFYKEGYGFKKILQLVQRSKRWLFKWLHRYKEHGINGLKDQNRAPKRIWRKTSERLVRKVISIREELESHKTRRSAFSGIGAEVIHWENACVGSYGGVPVEYFAIFFVGMPEDIAFKGGV